MASEPWFKFYASDYLVDDRVDDLPLEAQAILLRMWCLCHIAGSCPADSEEIARKTRLSAQAVAEHRAQLDGFFELRDGRLYSRRMEKERKKSESARANANRRWGADADGNANGNADCNAQSQSQSQSQISESKPASEANLSPSVKPVFSSKEKQYSQIDFDERDWRKLCSAYEEIRLSRSAAIGGASSLTEKQVLEWAAELSGLTIPRIVEIEARAKKWPAREASA